MGKAIPSQHNPAAVLRSRYKIVRALLAIALIAIVGLMATVVILANDSEVVSTGERVATLSGHTSGTHRVQPGRLPSRDHW